MTLDPIDCTILRMYGQGMTITQIAARVSYSPEGVKSRLRTARHRWDARNTLHLMVLATRAGLL